jgi:hypothetical protein
MAGSKSPEMAARSDRRAPLLLAQAIAGVTVLRPRSRDVRPFNGRA